MKIGVPKEIKPSERRVALTPGGTRELVAAGHEVVVEPGAGDGSGHPDEAYAAAGAALADGAASVFDRADLVVKVKEPQQEEVSHLHEGQLLFTYLHLAADPGLTRSLARTGATCLAYETIADDFGRLPLLTPMSQIAGRLAAHMVATLLHSHPRARPMLIGGVPGVAPACVVIVGGGVVGTAAAAVAASAQAEVHVLDRSVVRLAELDATLDGRVRTHFATATALDELLPCADAVIGAVLVHGARAPSVLYRHQLGQLRRGVVLVDVSIDQGGCFETSRPTTHAEPTYELDGVIHYCVTNMPGAVPVSSTAALTNATLPYLMRLADHGLDVLADPGMRAGLNVMRGSVTCAPVAQAAGLPYLPAEEALDHAAVRTH